MVMEETPPIDVLVIEDDADTRANLRDILELDDHSVTAVATAAEAMNHSDLARFSAIILDRRLPDAIAEQLLPRLKARAPDAAVIVVTGYADIQGAIAALRQGATDYILKPINADVLRASLTRVAERKRLALAKERSEAVFRQLVEAADCMIVILRPDHTILYFSPFAERLTGYASAEVVGRDFVTLFLAGSDREAIAGEFARVLAGSPTLGFENTVVCRNGARRVIAMNARRLPDYAGGPAILKVGQDITHLKHAQERALHAERLAAIGQVVTGLAHESRNALQRSQACLEMLALVVKDRPEALDLIARLQSAQDHLHVLYEDVRGYAAPIVLDRSRCDLRKIWRDAWGDLEPARKAKEATLRELAGEVDLTCDADAFRMGQVFRNILDNSVAAGRAPVVVEVRAEATLFDDQPALRLVFSDNGPGLDSQQRQQVFDPFYTTKAKGTGLGMPIARRIVEAHGGQINLGDGNGSGAVFVVTLPRGTP
jgi:PAS domain S-box-containing protein